MAVTVAIPVYNGLAYLRQTLPALARHGYEHVYVLDDASTDGSADFAAGLPHVQVIAGQRRLGPAGNRNRVLECALDEYLLFLDADVEILTDDSAAAIESAFARYPRMGVMGALIIDDTGSPIPWYCGYEQSPFRRGVSEALSYIAARHGHDEAVMRSVREYALGHVAHFEPVGDRMVDWVIEQFFAVRSELFVGLAGFDIEFPFFHDGPDFCKRLRPLNYETRTIPSIRARHLDMHTGTDGERHAKMIRSTIHWYRKHFGLSPDIIERFFLD